eukprot:2450415-Amphidinium_carterae.1
MQDTDYDWFSGVWRPTTSQPMAQSLPVLMERTAREIENDKAIGGMRNPARSLTKLGVEHRK